MIRFIHTADIHFGMENYGKIDSTTGIHTRLLDFQKALNLCIDRAIEEDVDFFLFAGDAYKTTHPSPTQQRLLIECLLRLFQAHIPVVIVIGNHDNPLSFGKAHSLDLFNRIPLSGFHVIDKPRSFTLTTKSGPVQIVGIPWPSRPTLALNATEHKKPDELNTLISSSVTSLVKDYAQKLDMNLPAVLTAHLTVSTAIFSGSERRAIHGKDPLFLPSQLAIDPFDYVALGHIHRYQNLNPNSHPAVVYSGSIDRIDFGERKESKGFCLVTIDDNKKTDHEFIELPTRPFVQVELHLVEEKSQTEQIIAELRKHTLDNAIIKVLYHIPVGCQDKVDTKAIYNVCSKAMYIVGIIPVHKPKIREGRSSLHVNMDFETLLTTYFKHKDIPAKKIERLITLAQELKNSRETTEN